MELVSIITANYNGSRYLASAIESVLAQSYPHLEYLIVDDGSTDDSADIIRDYASRDARIKAIFLSENKGVARARNAGIENSNGNFISFLDADDTWAADKIEKQLAVFRQHPQAGLVVTDAALMDAQGQLLQQRKPRKQSKQGRVSLYDYIAGRCLLSINAMTRRECLETSGLFNPDYVIGEDYELWMRITRSYEYYYLDEALHYYRIHEQNATRDKLFNRESKIKILQQMVDRNPELMEELGRRFKVIMQRKYNSLGKAYFLSGRYSDAQDCFAKSLGIGGSLVQNLKARFWGLALRSKLQRIEVEADEIGRGS